MNIKQKIRDYQINIDYKKDSSIFLDLADEIIKSSKYKLNTKTYLLIPEQRKELSEMLYEYMISNNKPMPIDLSLKISQIMNKFYESAKELGFTVITNLSEYRGDGVLFDLLGTQSNERGLIFEESNNIPDITIPLTMSIDDYLLNPFYPAVFKNITANRGEDIYLIENCDQLKKITALFELPESILINLNNEFVVQKYIKSFDNLNSSIRVLTSCTGDILSSLFLISTDKESKKRVKKLGINVFNPCEYLSDPDSDYFLNSKNILSNTSAGGKAIPLNIENSKLSAEEEILLTLHGIDIESFSLPEQIIEQCKIIANHWKSKKGIVLGIDFIYNSEDNKWYYLETNRNPSVDGYSIFMNLNSYLRKDVKVLMQLDSLMKIVEKIMTDKIEKNEVKNKL